MKEKLSDIYILLDISSLAIAEREGEEDSLFSFTASPVQSQVSIGSKEN
jgi:hypothetical protein